MNDSGPILEIKNLVKHFETKTKVFQRKPPVVHAVNGIDLSIDKETTLGLVGESGCGKSTVGRLILRLYFPTSGDVIFEGKNIVALNKEELKRLRRDIQIIFQDPSGSLDPRMTVERVIGEGIAIQKLMNPADRRERVKELMEMTGIPSRYLLRYPHEFSGGQKQRIGIARALAVDSKFIVCDEPVSALDVSIQAQIINLLADLREKFHLTYLFISHDLAVVRHISIDIAVMYLGRIVEIAPSIDLYKTPLHPYTQALLAAIPISHPRNRKKRELLTGDVPTPIDIPPGCAFHQRCRYAMDRCKKDLPELKEMGKNHQAACWLY